MYQQTAPRRSPVSGVKKNKKGVVIEGIAREGVKLVEGETLEHTIRRMVAQNEPIKSEVMLIMAPIVTGKQIGRAHV